MSAIHDGSSVAELRAHLASIESTVTEISGPALAHVIAYLRAEIERKSTELARQVEKVRQDCRIAQLVSEMVGEGWDRKTATEIAREFARAGA